MRLRAIVSPVPPASSAAQGLSTAAVSPVAPTPVSPVAPATRTAGGTAAQPVRDEVHSL